jgi:hypothetical protein
MPKRIEPTTAAILIAAILAIALVAVFGDAKIQVAIAGAIAVTAAAFARNLIKAKDAEDEDKPPPPPLGPPPWLVFFVLATTFTRTLVACAPATPAEMAHEAEAGFTTELSSCAATEPTHTKIEACKARVRAKWNVPAPGGR